MITFQQIKDICTAICTAYGITDTDGKRITKELSPDQLSAVLAGDLSGVPAVAARLGIVQAPTEGNMELDHETPTGETVQPDHGKHTEHAEKRPKNARKGTKKEKPIECTPVVAPAPAEPIKAYDVEPVEVLERVTGEIVEDDHDTLPASIQCDIENWLAEFSQKYNLDLEKCAGLQWRSVCIYIGQRVQKSGILLDHARMKTHGGKIYDVHKVEILMHIWEYLTGLYKHIPLACDFISFTGVSHEWFYDSRGLLTSSRVELTKKMRAIEEKALSAALADSRENPTGRIYYTKARLGWQETTTIQHVSATAAAPTVTALPVFDTSSNTTES